MWPHRLARVHAQQHLQGGVDEGGGGGEGGGGDGGGEGGGGEGGGGGGGGGGGSVTVISSIATHPAENSQAPKSKYRYSRLTICISSSQIDYQ